MRTYLHDSSSLARLAQGLALVAFCATLLPVVGGCGTEDGSAVRLRVTHLDPAQGAVEVGLDGKRRVPLLAYGDSSRYFGTTSAVRNLRLVSANDRRPLLDLELDLLPGDALTTYLFGLDDNAPKPLILADGQRPEADKVLMRVVHAVEDMPGVTVRVTPSAGSDLTKGLTYRQGSDYVELPWAETMALTVDESTGPQRFYEIKSLGLERGRAYTVLIYGRLASQKNPLSVKLIEDGGSRGDEQPSVELADAQILFIHGSPGADKLTLSIDNEDPVSPPISYPGATSYQVLSAGEHILKVRSQTGNATVLERTVSLKPGRRYSFVAANLPAQIEGLLFEDPLLQPIAGRARLRLLNIAPEAPTLDMQIPGDIAYLFSNVSFREGTEFAPLPAQKLTFELRSAQTGALLLTAADVDLKDGKSYTLYTRGTQGAGDFGVELVENAL
jgi:hypothetical protein